MDAMDGTPSVHPSLRKRKIVHIDMDAFYASIEIRDNPELRGKPIVVGGSPNSRGVVCTASYEARKFGVRSAMACSRAARLCPQAVFLPPRFAAYVEVSRQIREIFQTYTSLIEPVSLDEAYLDVTNNPQGLYAVKVARGIQQEVLKETGLTCSAGVAPNKLVAKIASDLRKPAGFTVVLPELVREFVGSLTVRKLNGVGPVAEQRLAQLGIRFCRDAWDSVRQQLLSDLGGYGQWLILATQGIDDSEVCTNWERKSYGREETFATDILDIAVLDAELRSLAESVGEGLAQQSLRAKRVCVKVKYEDFVSVTRQACLPEAICSAEAFFELGCILLRRTEAGRRRVRLLGMSVSALVNDGDGAGVGEGEI